VRQGSPQSWHTPACAALQFAPAQSFHSNA
jgi:hypothetical protein